jgi:hypothetical protein
MAPERKPLPLFVARVNLLVIMEIILHLTTLADLTYGVECEPAAGSVDNLHADKPWLRETRLPLAPVNQGNQTCFDYTMTENDTFASVAGEEQSGVADVYMPIIGMLHMLLNHRQPV